VIRYRNARALLAALVLSSSLGGCAYRHAASDSWLYAAAPTAVDAYSSSLVVSWPTLAGNAVGAVVGAVVAFPVYLMSPLWGSGTFDARTFRNIQDTHTLMFGAVTGLPFLGPGLICSALGEPPFEGSFWYSLTIDEDED
jgi:hypothetical protein